MRRSRSCDRGARAATRCPRARGTARAVRRSARACRRCRRRRRPADGSRSAVGGSRAASLPWARTLTVVCLGMSSRLPRLAVIATVGGAFSGLFGVGGGTVIVPLLILWFGYREREATGTSLLAGVVAGTALQQRIPERSVAAIFAVLLVASAAVLIF